MPEQVAVIGAGSWGTALSIHCARMGMPVSLWVYEEDLARRMVEAGENDIYLPGENLPPNIKATNSFEECLTGAQIVFSVVPSHVARQVWAEARAFLPLDAIIINATKGIEEKTLLTSTEVLIESVGENILERKVTLSGPTFAKEVARGLPAAAVIAGRNMEIANQVQKILTSESLRFYTNRDYVGVEIAGSLKNVMAISVGICDGLALGHNARAALITRGLAEMARLGVALGADPLTFKGLAGLGDLVLTCTGDLSRNRTLGLRLGKGESLEQITGSTPMVAEGVRTTRSARDLALREKVEMPITEEIYQVLYDGRKPLSALKRLMNRSLKEEGY
jgi:glycerol-3-phosphate dehydrogenase (NAD(P)+)